MILTGKCKEKFWEWYKNREGKTLTPKELELISEEVLQNALIIDFFDSVGIYIEIHYSSFLGNRFLCIVNTNENHKVTSFQNNRHQAIKKAIKKANDLYNSRYENV
ncbi:MULTISPECIES: hypothetical protein [unclassified Empedobacter]|uniref:hypothetical protein n=1 Tax=unclassified Empedobacter TaxID=2643773 RepID=UPI0025C20350|nr:MULTISPECIES: hypothetical protein [unclassified Empedobacter]